MLNIKLICAILIFFGFLAGCKKQEVKTDVSQNQISVNTADNRQPENLPNNIILFIGRGGCCYGHIISLDKSGEIKYFVGEYVISENNSFSNMPEVFDPKAVKRNGKYLETNGKISIENLERLAQLLSDKNKIEFRDETIVTDDYLYQLFLNNKKIAYGYEVNLKSFPANLHEIIKIILSEIKLYELPGMA